MDWEVIVKYGNKTFTLQAEKVYESSQIMRIKVHGKTDYILLENDYPLILSTGSKKAIKWKVRKDIETDEVQKSAQLVADIISRLEYLVKGKNKQISHAEYLQQNKW